MSLEDDIGIISRVSLFEDLTQEQLRLLAFGAERLSLTKGRELFREGQKAECGYVVANGSIALFRETHQGRQQLGEVGPGMILGEMALLTEANRLTSAVAARDSQVIRINRSLFRRILEEYPDMAAALHDRLKDRLHGMLVQIGEMEDRFKAN